MSRPPSKVLLVEGADDLRVVPWLVELAGISWGTKKQPIVAISQCEGVDNLLAEGEIETRLKASGLTALGVIVDADESASSRWQTIRSRIISQFPLAPSVLPPEGLVLHHSHGPSFGAWIMPDNVSRGMMETFLLFLRPAENTALHELAATAVTQARTVGAPFLDPHRDKALIHTWLAWQNPPGRQMHQAIMERMLTAPNPTLTAFISWFSDLYSVPVVEPESPNAQR